MDRIYKQALTSYETKISAKRFLDVQLQNGVMTVWYIDNPKENKDYEVCLVGTGWEVDLDGMQYVRTVQNLDGYVWHVFVKKVEKEWTIEDILRREG